MCLPLIPDIFVLFPVFTDYWDDIDSVLFNFVVRLNFSCMQGLLFSILMLMTVSPFWEEGENRPLGKVPVKDKTFFDAYLVAPLL